MEFPGFLGNEQLKRNLSAAMDRSRNAHFYLISGPKGSGKHTLARLLCAALVCTEAKKPCCKCSQCRKALSSGHPDIITVDDAEHKTVPVEVIRQAREDLFIRPNEAPRKIYYVPRAQDVGLPGQNALLKVLEEPPAYGVFLLLTDNAHKLLPTVRSRCVELKLQPLPRETILAELRREFPQADEEAMQAAAIRSGGLLGQARDLLSQGDLWLQTTKDFAAAYLKKDTPALLKLLVPLEKSKRDALIPILQQWLDLLGGALTTRAGLPPLDAMTRAIAAGRTPQDLQRAIVVLEESIQYLQGNVSPGAVCGNLLWQLQ